MIIYKITNKINLKSYVGQTIRSIEKRWKEHLKSKSHCHALSSAIQKYGKENFEIKVLAHCSNIDEMNHREQYCIRLFNTLAPNGYNLTSGGKNKIASTETRLKNSRPGEKHPLYGKKHTEESKILMSVSHKGKKHTKESRLKMSQSKAGDKHWNFGNNMSEKHKEILQIWYSENMLKMKELLKNNNEIKKIKIKCNENNEIYDSINSAAKKINTSPSNITQHLKGKFKQIKGFTFSYYRGENE